MTHCCKVLVLVNNPLIKGGKRLGVADCASTPPACYDPRPADPSAHASRNAGLMFSDRSFPLSNAVLQQTRRTLVRRI